MQGSRVLDIYCTSFKHKYNDIAQLDFVCFETAPFWTCRNSLEILKTD